MKKKLTATVLIIVAVLILLGGRIAAHSLAEAHISGDGWGYFNRALYISKFAKLPPLTIQPVGYSILLSKLASLGTEELVQASVQIQKVLDLAVIFALAYFSWLLSLKISSKSIRNYFILLCFSFLAIQPFTTKLSNNLYTESSVMALCFLGLGLFSLLLSKHFVNRGIGILTLILGGSAMGLASTMRLDIFALNISFLVVSIIAFLLLGWNLMARKGALFLCISLIIPFAVLSAQFNSTGELGFQTYSKTNYPIEFIGWTGSWRADRIEHQKFAWFSSNVDNLDTDAYPSKAFSSIEEKKEVESLFRLWKQQGYSGLVRSGFKDLVIKKRASQPFEYYLFNPLYRMYHHWVNLEGADFFLASFRIPSGWVSRSFVLFVFLLRIAILLLFLYGTLALAINIVQSLKVDNVPKESSIVNTLDASNFVVSLSIIFALMRTLEMGMLSTVGVGGLMEPRYVTVAFPPVLVVAIYGAFRLLDSQRGEDNLKISI